jgi:phosphoribosylformimino-5-aminoimidazole carboxamide ribotide isomerase
MIIYPAIDLRAGLVVRLRQGDFNAETRYQNDPVELAKYYAVAGAQWLHVVDLDAAKSPQNSQRELLRKIASVSSAKVQCGGGVRTELDVQNLLDCGIERVVVGSVAARDPTLFTSWLKKFGSDRLCLAADVKADPRGVFHVHTAGWTATSGLLLSQLLDELSGAGLRHVLCTDIALDGMLSGPNLNLYTALHERYADLQLQASGGVSVIPDLQRLRELGCAGAIVGKALLDGKFSISEALSC